MRDRSEPATSRTPPGGPQMSGQRPDQGGIGLGLFLVLAGVILLAERLGWIPRGMDWLFPVILVAWGVGELYRRLVAR